MSEVIYAAIIGVGGSVLVAIVSVITQLFITKNIIKANNKNLIDQIEFSEKSNLREKRLDKISKTVSELLTVTDAEIYEKLNYSKATNLITRIQLYLNVRNKAEFKLNQSLSNLGWIKRLYTSKKSFN